MQLTIRLKGPFLIALVLFTIAVTTFYSAYRLWKYYSYRKIVAASHAKRITNFERKPFNFKLNVDSGLEGYLLLAPYVKFNLRYGDLAIMDLKKGKIVYEKPMSGAVVDFRQWAIDGRVWYSYGIDDSAVKHVTLSSGHIVILDSAFQKVREVHLQAHDNVSVSEHEDLDLHDFIMLSDEHYYVMATYEKPVNNVPACLFPAPNVKVAATVIQEVQNGKVTWQWDASRYPEFYLSSEVSNRFYDSIETHDYIHTNSMTLDPADSNLVLSLRQLNQVVKIDRHSGNIIWRLGGRNSDFPLTREQAFLRQHNATFVHDTLLIFDNGDKTIRPYSRILEFRLDEKTKSVTYFKPFKISAPFTESLGSVQKMGDDYLVCGGTANYVMIVNSRTGVKKMQLQANQSFYRAYWVKKISGLNSFGK